LVAEEVYFLELVRYIHLNPIRAGLVRDVVSLSGYRWSSHPEYLSRKEVSWLAKGEILERFGKDLATARWSYLRYLSQASGEVPLSRGGLMASLQVLGMTIRDWRDRGRPFSDPRVLGLGRRVEELIVSEPGMVLPELTEEEVVGAVAGVYDVKVSEMRGRTRRDPIPQARKAAVWVWVKDLGRPGAKMGEYLGLRRGSVTNIQKGDWSDEGGEKLNQVRRELGIIKQ
jgi:hypothetical protein